MLYQVAEWGGGKTDPMLLNCSQHCLLLEWGLPVGPELRQLVGILWVSAIRCANHPLNYR